MISRLLFYETDILDVVTNHVYVVLCWQLSMLSVNGFNNSKYCSFIAFLGKKYVKAAYVKLFF